MVRDDLRLCVRERWEPIAQRLGNVPVQDLPSALKQTLIGGVLHQRMLEAITHITRRARAEQQLRLFKLR
jgi:hypothetical protein